MSDLDIAFSVGSVFVSDLDIAFYPVGSCLVFDLDIAFYPIGSGLVSDLNVACPFRERTTPYTKFFMMGTRHPTKREDTFPPLS